MPFNGSGTFTIVNTFIPNTTILSAAVNANFTDIATGLSDCLTRDGQAGMTAAFKAIAGSLAAPGISFTSDATSGLYLPATGKVGLVSHSLGLLINANIFRVLSATVQAGGSGYAVGDTITLTGGTAIVQPVLTVATLTGSAVSTVTVTYDGAYTVAPTNPVSQGSTSGSGTGATFNLTLNDPLASAYKSIITNEIGGLLWQKLGSSSFVSGIMAKANAYDYFRSLVTVGTNLALSNLTNPPTLTATFTVPPATVTNYLTGLTLSTAGGSGTFGIAAGEANDSTNAGTMFLNSAYTKTTASWALGTGNGGLDTGAIANTTWYHAFLIQRVDTGVTDILFSLSPTSPTLPTNYTLFRRIGSMKTDASAHWLAFTQVGDEFVWAAQVTDLSSQNSNGVRSSVTLAGIPTGIVVMAHFRAGQINGASGNMITLFTSLVENDVAAAGANADLQLQANSAQAADFDRLTNTAAQIGFRTSSTNGTVSSSTYGWRDTRGR